MRHFLTLSLSKVLLALGVLPATVERILKALACGARALAPRLAAARLGAIPLPMVAALADTLLRVAPGAVEQPVAGLDDGSTSSSPKAGQRPSITSLSAWDKRHQQSACTSQKARGGHLGPSPFSEPGPSIAPALRRPPRRSYAPRPPMQRPEVERRNRIRSTKKMVRNSDETLANDSGCVRTLFARFAPFL